MQRGFVFGLYGICTVSVNFFIYVLILRVNKHINFEL